MNYFQIADLVHYSCLKAHTIRIWEKRFAILKPKRTKGNSRYYSLQDVAYLLKVSLLNKSGYKISDIVKMSPEEIESKLLLLDDDENKQFREINKLIVSMFSLDTEEFEHILDRCILVWGIDITVNAVIMPFLERSQIFSSRDCRSEIDFALTIIRKKLILAIEKSEAKAIERKSVLLFLPAGEYFDIPLLYFNYLIKKMGLQVLYMGTNISTEKLNNVIEIKQPDYLLTYISPKYTAQLKKVIDPLKNKLSKSILLISGTKINTIRSEENIKFIDADRLTLESVLN